jgi:uncharacterized protein YbbC (DUF1343 family)
MKYSNDKFYRFKALNYIKDLAYKRIYAFLIFLHVATACASQHDTSVPEGPMHLFVSNSIVTGAQQTEKFLPLLENKRIAIVGNQTSLIGKTHLVDSLLKRKVNVVKVFSPEHGFRGDGDAGAKIKDGIDPSTGLSVISLYGDNKKPKASDLKDVDILLFDLQDVGVRFYTYISTLHYVMEAAAENKISVIVLDRPNPNGHIIDGPVKKEGYESFISMHPVPVIYGMTIGEYGQMINGEKWLKDGVQCQLSVIALENYTHATPYSLPIAPSPNLKTGNSINHYASLCFFEGTIVSVGRGTPTPFEIYGHPDFPKTGFSFTPQPSPGASDPLLKGQLCQGIDLTQQKSRLNKLSLDYLFYARDALHKKHGDKWINRVRFFNLLAGNDELIDQLNSFKSEEEIRNSWKADLEDFKVIRAKYLLYD